MPVALPAKSCENGGVPWGTESDQFTDAEARPGLSRYSGIAHTNAAPEPVIGVSLADAILVATAEAENAELKTLNTKHYPMLRNLRPAYNN